MWVTRNCGRALSASGNPGVSLPRARRNRQPTALNMRSYKRPPAVIAYHYSRAGEFEKAFHFWLLVADQALERLAFVESVGALNLALGEAEQIVDPALRASLKLEGQLKLGRALVFQKGPRDR